ncbi:MAG: NADAR family protein [Sandaracinus sp.]
MWLTRARWGALSNMASGFDLDLGMVRTGSSEGLYQALKFPDAPATQSAVLGAPTPKAAKRAARQHSAQARADWVRVRVHAMRWCLRVKAVQHPAFVAVLLQTGELPIVERSSRDDFWGALPEAEGVLTGRNVLGRLLMELRDEVRAWRVTPCLEPPGPALGTLLGAPLPRVFPRQAALPGIAEHDGQE